jgi:hypothetical protein
MTKDQDDVAKRLLETEAELDMLQEMKASDEETMD